MVLIWILAALLAIAVAASVFFASQIVFPRCYSLAESHAIEVEKGYMDDAGYDALGKREVRATSPHGYAMCGTYVPLSGSKKTVIIVHGVTYNRWGSVKYLSVFRKSGYNVLMIDQRRHGASGGRSSTFGFFERDDMVAWTDWALSELGEGGIVGTHGESMGAAVVLLHAAIDPRPSFVVADCPFSDLRRLLAYHLALDYHLPAFPLLGLSSAMAFLLSGGMSFGAVSPLKEVTAIEAPVFFIHGDADRYIEPYMSREMHEARLAAGLRSRLYLAPGAEHAGSWAIDRAEYDRQVTSFLGEL